MNQQSAFQLGQLVERFTSACMGLGHPAPIQGIHHDGEDILVDFEDYVDAYTPENVSGLNITSFDQRFLVDFFHQTLVKMVAEWSYLLTSTEATHESH